MIDIIKNRLNNLRKLFSDFDIEGYIVPSFDEYQSAYSPAFAKRLEYITGFSGSNGIAIILKSKALFFTDSRYTEQAHIELARDEFEIYDLSELKILVPAMNLGLDDMLFVERQISLLSNANLKFISGNLVDKIWEDKPSTPSSDVFSYPIEYAGLTPSVKIANIRKFMDKKAEMILITQPDSICWLLNIRASDIDFCPVMLGYLLMSKDRIWLFTNIARKYNAIAFEEVEILDTSEIKPFLKVITERVMVDSKFVPIGLASLIQNKVISEDPSIIMKACKEDIEIEGFVNAHIKDAIALCEILSSLECDDYDGSLTEYEISRKLTEERARQEGYITDSFPPIVGYQANGAIIHYRPEESSAKKVKGDGILLIDSGGHYFGGSTDVTRTIKIGADSASSEQKRRYTQVLKGHIAIARLKFIKGTSGGNMNILAHMYLWGDGVDYSHGTGHGVGNALFVHEGPQNISPNSNVILRKNMVLSNEPGFYKTGEFGIRIENLLYVTEAKEEGFLEFRQLTLVPYCKNLIDLSMLSSLELEYLSSYQAMIEGRIYPHLTEKAKKWVDRNRI